MQWATQGVVLAVAVCAGGYGAAVGALLPRVVYRLAVPPKSPWRGDCPEGHALEGPARGWLGRARCRGCVASAGTTGTEEAPPVKEPYGPAAGLFAAVSAAVCAGLALFVGPRPELAVWLLAAPFGFLLAAVDRRVQRLPDVLTLPLAGATAALLGAAALLPGAGGSWVRALLGGLALAGGHFVLFLVNPRGMGFGDVKLALTLGVALGWYGWEVLFAGAFLSFLLAAGYGTTLLLTRRAGRKSAMPFGPFMVLGTLAGVLLGGLAV